MKYRVMGASTDTGARVMLELDAQNRAAAERQAQLAHVEVMHLESIEEETFSDPDQSGAPRGARHRGEFHEHNHRIGFYAGLAALVLAGLVFLFWDLIRAMLGMI